MSMPVVVAFLSQKGGVGKSTLARSLAVAAERMGLRTLVADLDPQQRTLMRWLKTRTDLKLKPALKIEAYETAHAALQAAQSVDLVILDLPGHVNDDAGLVVRNADLVVQPTSPSVDDLHPAVLVFQALERVGTPRDRLVFSLCRVLGEKEADATRTYLERQGYRVARGCISERLGYRDALNLGRSLVESRQGNLNNAAQLLLLDLLDLALTRGIDATRAREPEPQETT
jgi:chromosome partitioning protein